MSKFNLNKAKDFAALTASAAGNLLGTFQRDEKEWNIVEATYKGGRRGSQPVRFHIFQSTQEVYQAALSVIRDLGGRRKVVIKIPYVDGQTTDDLGRDGETFNLEVLFHGVAYKNGMIDLMAALQQPQPGTLLHPVRGQVRCGLAPGGVELIHTYESVNAVAMRITLIEHNFDGGVFGNKVITIKTKLSAALSMLNKIARVIAAVAATVQLAVNIRNAIKAKIEEMRATLNAFLVDCNSTFNNGSSVDIPGAVPTTSGGLATPTRNATFGSTAQTAGVGGTSLLPGGYVRIGTNFTTVIVNSDPLANVPVALLSDTAKAAIAVLSLTKRNDVIRQQIIEIINDMQGGALGLGAVIFADEVLDLKNTAIAAQEVLEQGLASSRAQIISYTVPHVMSTREIAFRNGLDVNQAGEVELLNPELTSANFVDKDTVVLVPVST